MSSEGQRRVEEIVRTLLPQEEIKFEYHVGNRLRLDMYLPRLKLGIEYHGSQHFEFVSHFHKTKEKYLEAIQRDFEKIEACNKLGIAVVIFNYDDKLTQDFVFSKISDALDEEFEFEQELTWEEVMKKRAKEYRRDRYIEAKRRKQERDREQ